MRQPNNIVTLDIFLLDKVTLLLDVLKIKYRKKPNRTNTKKKLR